MLNGSSEMESMNVGGELTQAQQDAIAERIAAVLRERKQVGEERRRQARANWLRSSRLGQERYRLRTQVRDVA